MYSGKFVNNLSWICFKDQQGIFGNENISMQSNDWRCKRVTNDADLAWDDGYLDNLIAKSVQLGTAKLLLIQGCVLIVGKHVYLVYRQVNLPRQMKLRLCRNLSLS